MKNRMTAALVGFATMVALSLSANLHVAVAGAAGAGVEGVAAQAAGEQQAEKKPAWKSRDEYDAFQKIVTATDPTAKVNDAEAFLQKYPSSDFKDQAYYLEMQSYQQQNNPQKAMDAAREVLKSNPQDNVAVAALNYLSFAFPFVFKASDANKDTELSQAETEAKQGLDLLQKLQKPANVTEDQFSAQVKQLRADFNGALGFVALQRKDYANAITSLKAAQEDSPKNPYIAYRLGLAYLSSTPPDRNNAFWSLARSVSLAKDAKATDEPAIEQYLTQAYEDYHGTNEGLDQLIAQAGSSPTPPAGFQVTQPQAPKPTGNPNVDSFASNIAFPLKLGGDRATNAWKQLKGQPLELVGYVNSLDKGSDSPSVRIALDKAKAAGAYDIVLKDPSQPLIADLVPGDPVRFKGTIDSYVTAPTFVLTLSNGNINNEDLEAAESRKKAKEAPKPKPRHRTSH